MTGVLKKKKGKLWHRDRYAQREDHAKKHREMANKYRKRCSTLFIIIEMQIKTTVKSHLTPISMAIIKKTANSKCWRGCGENGTLLHC